MSDTLLTVTDLTMRFGGLTAVNDVSFEAKRGDITAVIGPNGAGKTTVFNCITGFYKPTAGSITIAHDARRSAAAGQAARPCDRQKRAGWPAPSRTSACSAA